MATTRIREVRDALDVAAGSGTMHESAVAALAEAVGQRTCNLEQYSATNLEAAADMADMYLEFEDFRIFLNEKLSEMDIRASSSSTNSVVQGAMPPSCFCSLGTASTGHAYSLLEALATQQAH